MQISEFYFYYATIFTCIMITYHISSLSEVFTLGLAVDMIHLSMNQAKI
jgi:hypothetical protein